MSDPTSRHELSLEPPLKKAKLNDTPANGSNHINGNSGTADDLGALYDRLSESSRKALFLKLVTTQPTLIREWYKVAETKENMQQSLKEKAEKIESEIRALLRIDVDLLTLGDPTAWWKDQAQLDQFRAQTESREHHMELDNAIRQFSTFLNSSVHTCSGLLDKGSQDLAFYCLQLVLEIYVESFITKDGLIAKDEEAKFVTLILVFYQSFIHNLNTTLPLNKQIDQTLARLSLNLIYEPNSKILDDHLRQNQKQ